MRVHPSHAGALTKCLEQNLNAERIEIIADPSREAGSILFETPRGNLDEMSDDQWVASFETTVLFVVRLIRGVLPSMKQKKWGRILTIQSVSVKQPLPELLLSNAVRPGVAGMMKTLALQLAKENILVNTLCPGKILTDRLLGGLKQSGLSREEYLTRQGAEVPMGRVGTAEEFASVAVFLASERASYVTGVSIQVDGGLVRGLL